VPFHHNTVIIRPGGGDSITPGPHKLFLDKLNPAQRAAIHKLGFIVGHPSDTPLAKSFTAPCPNVSDLTAFVVTLSYGPSD